VIHCEGRRAERVEGGVLDVPCWNEINATRTKAGFTFHLCFLCAYVFDHPTEPIEKRP
jgi:hypothetical protein